MLKEKFILATRINYLISCTLFLLIFFTSACSPSLPDRLYEGIAKSAAETVLLEGDLRLFSMHSEKSVKIIQVDNKNLSFPKSKVEILPGKHKIKACYSEPYRKCGWLDSSCITGSYCGFQGRFSFEHEFKAGFAYGINVGNLNKPFDPTANRHRVMIKNRNTGNKQYQEDIDVKDIEIHLDCQSSAPDLFDFFGSDC